MPSYAAAAPVACRCVQWLREVRGIEIKGDAWTIPAESLKMADVGHVLLTTEGPGHAAEIIGFRGEVQESGYIHPEYIEVIESNYTRCKVGTRLIPWNSPVIRGVYRAS